jgi:hypothetical protein
MLRAGALFAVVAMLVLSGCGAAGVDDGSIAGIVYGNASGGSVSKTPLAGVSVVAVREGETPEIIRNTKTDANGEFLLGGLPTGAYVIGFDTDGYRTVTTEEGNTTDRSAVGDQVRVFVEPGMTSIAPDQTLVALAQEGDATLVMTVLDRVTAQPVTHATILAGSAVTSNGGTNGIYTLSVPVIVPDGSVLGTQPQATSYTVTADGYVTDPAATVQLVANETINITVSVNPAVAYISGQIEIAAFQSLYTMTDVVITSDQIPRSALISGLNIEANGYFSVNVPCSNSFTTRQFNLKFSHPLLQNTVVSNIVAPRANGTRQLTSPVVMSGVTVDVVGTVADSFGNAPNQTNPSGLPDMVTITETGQMANIVNGSYTIPNVPICSSQTKPNGFNLEATAYNPLASNPSGGIGMVESGAKGITPVSDGTANPIFQAPLITLGSS